MTYSGRALELAQAAQETLVWRGITADDWVVIYTDTSKDAWVRVSGQ